MYSGSSKHSHHISKIADVIPTVRVSTVGFQLLRGVLARFHCAVLYGGEGEEERKSGRGREGGERGRGREREREERSVGGRQLAVCTYLAHVSGVFV